MKLTLLIFALSLVGCGGGKGESCYGNNTCDSDLQCVQVGYHERQCWHTDDIKIWSKDGVQIRTPTASKTSAD